MKDRTLLLSLIFAGLIHAGLLALGLPTIEPATLAMPQAVQVSLVPGPALASAPAGPPPAKEQEALKPAVHQAKKTPPQEKVEEALPKKPKSTPLPKPVSPPKPELIPPPRPEPVPLPEPEPEPEPKLVDQIIQDAPSESQPTEPEQSSEVTEEIEQASASSAAEIASKADSLMTAGSEGFNSTEEGAMSTERNSRGTGGGGVDKMPSYSYNPKPRYPRQARNAGQEGTVILRVEVLFSGRVARIEIDKSTGYNILDTAAVEAVKRWRFTPAKRGSRSVTSWVLIPIEFNLRD